jgi:hypothetical protein
MIKFIKKLLGFFHKKKATLEENIQRANLQVKKELQYNIRKNKTVQQLVDESLVRKDKHISSGKINPSQMGKCYRAQYWYRKGEEPSNPPDARTLRVFKVGNIFHDYIEGFFPEHQKEVEFETEDVKGRVDILLDDEVVELKSQHSRAFWHMQKEEYDINKGKETNILQLMTGAYFLKKPKGRLVFISKDDLCINEYGFFLTNWEEKVKTELNILRQIWDSDSLPDAIPRAYLDAKGISGECAYCSYRDKCKQFKNGGGK